MFFSETCEINKKSPQAAKIAEKKFVNIKDSLTNQFLVRVSVYPNMTISSLKQQLQKEIGGNGNIG